ncbi:hypothetical protein CDAR_483051 [Caerostris darwini]|uniref:Uncharacterized protein n=1 Tax=Caerostris darwini TaxID=1538125 RepID=A0AAV4V4K7_9ARAC|nr:hypothetical protein CDAR_483051 [Caerostris darwini]
MLQKMFKVSKQCMRSTEGPWIDGPGQTHQDFFNTRSSNVYCNETDLTGVAHITALIAPKERNPLLLFWYITLQEPSSIQPLSCSCIAVLIIK